MTASSSLGALLSYDLGALHVTGAPRPDPKIGAELDRYGAIASTRLLDISDDGSQLLVLQTGDAAVLTAPLAAPHAVTKDVDVIWAAFGEQGAIDASLSVMVGGDAEDFAAAGEVFKAVGKTVALVGPAGSGQTVKAANQLIVAGTIELVAEAIVFLEAYGVDTEAAIKVLAGGLAGNTILQRKAAGMLARDFTPGFRIALHDKDMGIVTAAAREAGVVIPLGAVAAQLVASLKAQGDGALDHSALLKLVLQLSGRQGDRSEEK